MKAKPCLTIISGFCLASIGLGMIFSYQKSLRVAIDTYENELGISQGGYRILAESPEIARQQIRPFWFCIAGFIISFFGFNLVSSSLYQTSTREGEPRIG